MATWVVLVANLAKMLTKQQPPTKLRKRNMYAQNRNNEGLKTIFWHRVPLKDGAWRSGSKIPLEASCQMVLCLWLVKHNLKQIIN